MNSTLADIVQNLPDSPGVYRFYNSESVLIYVGKAKSLKKRVSSYFTKSTGVSRKTLKLVSEIHSIEYVLSNTEFDALLLENNLIKENQPKYNILLKDDKTFPYICIYNEPFPRIVYTRKYNPKLGQYYGPYSSVVAMKNVLDLVRKIYTIRTCSLLLSHENIAQKKFKVCLEYHIGNCKGPCERLQQEDNYLADIDQARYILKGNLSIVEHHFKQQMQIASEALEFEKAQMYFEKLTLLEKFQAKSLVVSTSISNTDVFSITSVEKYAYVNYMQINEGAIIYSKTVEIKKRLEEPDEEILSYSIQELRSQSLNENKTILTNIKIQFPDSEIELIVPKIGDKRKLVDLSLRNAFELRKQKEATRGEKQSKSLEILKIMQQDMHLPATPVIIECFDNSNLQGSNPVASMVRFVNAKPDKKGYRHFNIKTVEGPDDFASMKEIVGRRYKRILEENMPLPDLILVDGGKGQLSSACEALKELNLYGKIPIAGIAKRLEEIYYPEDSLPLLMNKKSVGLLLLQQIRDEAHRFAITFHRLKRSKSTFTTDLENIPGIGKSTANKLLKEFKSFKKIKEASLEELSRVVGDKKAEQIKALK